MSPKHVLYTSGCLPPLRFGLYVFEHGGTKRLVISVFDIMTSMMVPPPHSPHSSFIILLDFCTVLVMYYCAEYFGTPNVFKGILYDSNYCIFHFYQEKDSVVFSVFMLTMGKCTTAWWIPKRCLFVFHFVTGLCLKFLTGIFMVLSKVPD